MTFGRARVRPLLAVAALALLPLTAAADATAAVRSADSTPSPAPSSQAAATGPAVPLTFGLKPKDFGGKARPNFRFQIAPGQITNDAVSLYNLSDVPLKLRLFASDAYTNPQGTIVALTADQKPTDAGSWLRLLIPADSTLVVPARSKVDVPFTVTIPTSATPGDHAGAIVVSLRGSTASQQSGPALAVDSRVSTSVNLRVSGEVRSALEIVDLRATYAATLNPIEPGSAVVTYRLRNTGNIAQAARVETSLNGLFGPGVRPVVTELPVMTPGSELEVEVPITDVWPVFRYTATVTATPLAQIGDPVGDVVNAETTFWAIPWALLGLVLAIIALAGTAYVYLRRRDDSAPPPGRHGSAAESALAAASGVSA